MEKKKFKERAVIDAAIIWAEIKEKNFKKKYGKSKFLTIYFFLTNTEAQIFDAVKEYKSK